LFCFLKKVLIKLRTFFNVYTVIAVSTTNDTITEEFVVIAGYHTGWLPVKISTATAQRTQQSN
jgi:hypothetical protein